MSGDRNRQMNLIDLTKYPGPEADPVQMKEILVHTDTTTHNVRLLMLFSVNFVVIQSTADKSMSDCRLKSTSTYPYMYSSIIHKKKKKGGNNHVGQLHND